MRAALSVIAAGAALAATLGATAAPGSLPNLAAPSPSPTPLPRPSFSPLAPEPDDEQRTERQQRALDDRIAVAERTFAAEQARGARLDAALAAQRARLGERQGPIADLLAGLATLARRPALLSLLSPASTAELVHLRAALDTMVPAVQARTAALRGEVWRTRALQASAGNARAAIDRGRERLDAARRELSSLRDGTVFGDIPADDAARAAAIGEETRELLDQLSAIGDEQARLEDLVRLPGPPRLVAGAGASSGAAYRLPARGRLVTGFGEVSANGVRARGLTFATAPGSAVVAPAPGKVAYARPFRGYGGVVIIDHGAGWLTLLAGLGPISVGEGTFVASGAPIGLARDSADAELTVELRRRGRPVDLLQLVG